MASGAGLAASAGLGAGFAAGAGFTASAVFGAGFGAGLALSSAAFAVCSPAAAAACAFSCFLSSLPFLAFQTSAGCGFLFALSRFCTSEKGTTTPALDEDAAGAVSESTAQAAGSIRPAISAPTGASRNFFNLISEFNYLFQSVRDLTENTVPRRLNTAPSGVIEVRTMPGMKVSPSESCLPLSLMKRFAGSLE